MLKIITRFLLGDCLEAGCVISWEDKLLVCSPFILDSISFAYLYCTCYRAHPYISVQTQIVLCTYSTHCDTLLYLAFPILIFITPMNIFLLLFPCYVSIYNLCICLSSLNARFVFLRLTEYDIFQWIYYFSDNENFIFFKGEQIFIVYIYHIFLTHSSASCHSEWLYSLGIKNGMDTQGSVIWSRESFHCNWHHILGSQF